MNLSTECPNATVTLISILPRDKKESIRRGNINITNKLLEEKSGKHDLYFLKYTVAKCGSIT